MVPPGDALPRDPDLGSDTDPACGGPTGSDCPEQSWVLPGKTVQKEWWGLGGRSESLCS